LTKVIHLFKKKYCGSFKRFEKVYLLYMIRICTDNIILIYKRKYEKGGGEGRGQ